MKISPVAIIGGGPSGITCALQLKRYGIEAILFEKDMIGGLLNNAFCVENYLGFPKGIGGSVLVSHFVKHIKSYKLKIIKKEVLKIFYKNERFLIQTKDKDYQSFILVIASGTRPKRLSVNIIGKCAKRIFYEVKDLKNVRNRKIGILGGGDAAFDYALSLSSKNQVIILHRGLKSRCIPALYQKAKKEKSILYLGNTRLKKIEWHQNSLRLICNGGKIFQVDYLVVAIGREPEFSFLSSNLKNNLVNLVKENRLYIIGDAKNREFRQVAIATGDGIKTAMKIYEDNW